MPEKKYEEMSLEALEAEDAALEAEAAELEAKRAALHTQLEIARNSRDASSESTRSTSSRVSWLDLGKMAVANVSRAHIDRLRLYKWGNESITKQEVLNIVNGLPEPYNSEVSRYVERNNIRWLQEYLNDRMDSWEIDLDGLTRALNVRNIPFTDGHILEDDKFWPQTLETIRFLIRQLNWDPEEPEYSEINVRVEIKLPAQGEVRPEDLVELPEWGTAEFEDGKGIDKEKSGEQEVVVLVRVWGKVERVTVVVIVNVENQTARVEKKKEEEEDGQKKKGRQTPDRLSDDVEKEPNLDWIKEEMSDAMQEIKNKNPKMNRSPERNSYDKNFDIDVARNRVILKTWWISLRSSAKESIDDNRCEIDWKTWDMYIVCGKNEYKMPLHFGKFALEKGYPTGDNDNNRQKIRAFTEVWNLMNMMKAHAVFNGKWAIEYQTFWSDWLGLDPWIHLNTRNWWFADTKLVKNQTLDELARRYSHLWLKFDKETKIQIASLLTAMKYDLWRITWDPDIETNHSGYDALNKEHIKWVKHYSKRYNRWSA